MLEYVRLFGDKLASLDRPSVLSLPPQQCRVLFHLNPLLGTKKVSNTNGTV
jgi:hypothetical protein